MANLELSPLGTLVWWDASGGMRAEHADLVAAIGRLGLDGIVKLPRVNVQGQIRRVHSTWTHRRGNADRFRVEPIAYDTTRANVERAGLMKLERSANGEEVGYTQIGIIESHYDTSQDVVLFRYLDGGTGFELPAAVMSSIIDDVKSARLVWNDTIRASVIEPLLSAPVEAGGAGGISIRKQGGVWYVTDAGSAAVAKLREVVQSTTSTTIATATIGNDENSRSSIASSVSKTLLDEVSDLEKRMDMWNSRSKDELNDSRTKASIGRAIGDAADMIKRAQLFESALSIKLTDLREKSREVYTEMSALMGLPPETVTIMANSVFGKVVS